MRPLLLSSALLLAASCTELAPRPPPADRFIYPNGIVHRKPPGSSQGVLYVASANFDRCYDQGSVLAVDLDRVGAQGSGLPPIGTDVGSEPLQIHELNASADALVYIQSFAGDMAVWERPGAAPRLFIPTRADGDYVHAIDIPESTRLACVGSTGRDCIEGAVSLSQVQGATGDLPRAPAPIGASVDDTGKVWVTHAEPADSPARSNTNYQSYIVRLDGESLTPSPDQFFSLATNEMAQGGSHAVAIGSRYVFVTGRFASGVSSIDSVRRFLVRMVDRQNPRRLLDSALDLDYDAVEARGIAVTADQTRLYVVARAPDALLVVDVLGANTDQPRLYVVGAVPLPDEPSQVKLIPRQGRSELVVVSCSAAGVVSFYDPDVGQLVAQVDVGRQPYGLAVQMHEAGNAARVFASNFGDGRIAVVDIPDLTSPQKVRLVAHLGAPQDRKGEAGASTCQEVQQ